jgi:hypothetical protein
MEPKFEIGQLSGPATTARSCAAIPYVAEDWTVTGFLRQWRKSDGTPDDEGPKGHVRR